MTAKEWRNLSPDDQPSRAELYDALEAAEAAEAENERLRAAILDIDAHATPLGEDDDGFVSVGYAVSVGSLHRALGIIGHPAPPCDRLACPRAEAAETLLAEAVELLRAVLTHDEDAQSDAMHAIDAFLARVGSVTPTKEN